MSLKQFLRTVWVRRWTAVLAAVSCLVAGGLAVLIMPKTYVSETRVMLSGLEIDPITGEPLSLTAARALMPTQIELIRDNRVAGRVVDRLGWTKSPERRAAYESSGETKVDFRRWLSQPVADSTSAKAVDLSNIIVISYASSDPVDAARMADAVRDAYIEESLDYKREKARKAADWFDKEAQQLRTQLAAAEARKAEFERANGIILLDDGTDADTARLQSLSGSVDVPQTQTVGGGGNPNASQIATLDARIASESQTLGPNHPQIQDLQRQRAALASSGRGGGGVHTVVTGPSIASQVAGARAQVLAQRGKVEEARRLWTDVKVLQEQYGKSAARAADLRQTADSNDAGIVPLGVAIPPSAPSSPKIPLVLVGSALLGLALGLMLGLISELMKRRVRGFDDLEGLSVPLIGVINARSLPALPN